MCAERCRMRATARLPPPTPPHRKSGLPDLGTIVRNPGGPGFRGGGEQNEQECSSRLAVTAVNGEMGCVELRRQVDDSVRLPPSFASAP